MEKNNKQTTQFVLLVIGLITLAKMLVGHFLELGNDEVYYWSYLKYPELSHFDHPGMIGWMLQIFTLNGTFDSELFMRLPGIVFSAINAWVLFKFAQKKWNVKVAQYAAIMYLCSFYFSVIAGLFILPDSVQLIFWLPALLYSVNIFTHAPQEVAFKKMFLFAVLSGLALLSKYHAVFLWLGAGFYVLLFNWKWLVSWKWYAGALVFTLFALPIVIWNDENDWISFTFHGDRVGLFEGGFNATSFIQFFLGQVFYQNPLFFVVMVLAVFKLKRKDATQRYLLYAALPLVAAPLFGAMFKTTLPHWSGPTFISFILLAAHYVEVNKWGKRLYNVGCGLFVAVLVAAPFLINSGWLVSQNNLKQARVDFTLDLYGWQQASGKLQAWFQENSNDKTPVLVTNKWFPGGHVDYYFARPLKIRHLVKGRLQDIHKYKWINEARGPIQENEQAYYISTARYFSEPLKAYSSQVCTSTLVKTIPIERGGEVVNEVYVYEMDFCP